MLELKGIAGVLYTVSEWIMRLSAVNLMWFILSLPFFTLLVAIDMSDSAGRIWFGLAAWLFVTFLFFPATAAVFSVARSWIVEEDYSSAFKKYIYHLKSDYKASIKTGALFALVWLVWYYNYFYFYSEQNSVAFLFLIIGLGMFIFTVNFLSISAHYDMSSKARMKNAFFISAGRPLTSLSILASSAVLLWISLFQLLWLLPLLVCSLIAFVSFSAFHKATVKITGKAASNTTA
ncbi:DUF624 domain-containing protein [Planococcus sp. ISL-109]|uniref:YesL family protein n=1 Tax=Planococcus sp. ISL-109 TaxID=2819166 RepID=UPI001BE8FAF6|nr:DUF624 domain-containing protein [Planococcus sp. ISL-109]MBT2583916.1 DUF624 domain-containing protein [Planococcus sp. ISL-109]